jgi:primosomal protein N' (replication factor Y) (superfamily II helicase)
LNKKHRERSCLRVAVALPVKKTFSYALPERLGEEVRVGHRVVVPFNNRRITGYVLGQVPQDQDEDLKEILEIPDPEPMFHRGMVPLFEWMSDYYLHPIGQVIQSCLPGGLNESTYRTADLTHEGLGALLKLPDHDEDKALLEWIERHPGRRLAGTLRKARQLEARGWIRVRERRRKGQAGPLRRKFVRPVKGSSLDEALAMRGGRNRAGGESEFLDAVFSSGPMPMSELTGRFRNGSYLVKKWIDKGVVECFTGTVYRNPAGRIMFPSPVPDRLHDQQVSAVSHSQRCLDRGTFSSSMLYGVTGSGKTEVYYRSAEHAFESGRQVILMVPEISLAVYMEGIFRSRLGDRVAIYHSGLSRGERYDQWMRMVRGDVDLVIGARSALFSPLPRLGLIIVDEEHDSAYKQESAPRYQARDTAVVRAKMEKALVILGSGTPSVQSYQNGMSGRYHLLFMPERVERRPLPEIEVVDMKTLKEGKEGQEMISPRLRDEIGGNLDRGNQTILFLNRRGFHRLCLCRSCGKALRCPNCDVALIYHLKEDRLSCHYCGFHTGTEETCPACGGGKLRSYGFGTEKLEHELGVLFPKARLARMDTDSTRRKGESFRILKRFSEKEIDILVGTQMITKGYDFPGVTLVGVIAADLSLGFPDFRAGERTYQLLSQAAGRSGRGDRRGKVIIQTFNPDHYAIQAATGHDYPLFFEQERELREQLGYPPFSSLACLKLSGNSRAGTSAAVNRLGLLIKGLLAGWPKRGREIKVLGPVEAPISKIKGKYRWQFLAKCKSGPLLRHFLSRIQERSRKDLKTSGVRLTLDVDPYQML